MLWTRSSVLCRLKRKEKLDHQGCTNNKVKSIYSLDVNDDFCSSFSSNNKKQKKNWELYVTLQIKVYLSHFPKTNLNLCIKTRPVTVKADATVNVWFLNSVCMTAWFLGQVNVNKSQTYILVQYTAASDPDKTDPIFCGDSRLFLAQCSCPTDRDVNVSFFLWTNISGFFVP